MGSENIIQAGIDIPIPGSRTRNFKLGMKAQAWLAHKHGTIKRVYSKLSGEIDEENNPVEKLLDGDMTECQLNALVDIVYAGLMRDAEKNDEAFTHEDALNLVDDLGVDKFFSVIAGNQKEALPDAPPADPTNAPA